MKITKKETPKKKPKKLKLKITKTIIKNEDFERRPIEYNWGGHIPYPPKDCEKKELMFEHCGVTWIDCSICHTCSVISKCKRRKEWKKEMKRKK